MLCFGAKDCIPFLMTLYIFFFIYWNKLCYNVINQLTGKTHQQLKKCRNFGKDSFFFFSGKTQLPYSTKFNKKK